MPFLDAADAERGRVIPNDARHRKATASSKNSHFDCVMKDTVVIVDVSALYAY